MATLTIDLPAAPQTQATYRLAADCPHCGVPLVLRQHRPTGTLFTGYNYIDRNQAYITNDDERATTHKTYTSQVA